MKKGDVITIGSEPHIQLAKYALSVKPSASVTYTVGARPAADLKEAKIKLRCLLFASLQVELEFVDAVVGSVVDDDVELTIESLATLCMEEIENNG